MKTNIQISRLLFLALALSVLSSFSAMPGAHSFQVYLDGKQLADQYVGKNTAIPRITITNQSQLLVKYNECNHTTRARVLTIKDENDVVLKEWKFEGETIGFKDPMTCTIREIAALKHKTVKLFYSSAEFQARTQIATLTFEGLI